MEPRLVIARATIHLDGLPFGGTAIVDLSQPYVSMCVESGYLVVEAVVDGG